MPLTAHYLPELEATERLYIQDLLEDMSHLTAIVGLVAIPGLQRFWLGQIGTGFLYLFTWGLLLFGTIADLVRYKNLAFTYNQGVARQIAANLPLREGKSPSNIAEPAFRSNRGFVSQSHHA